jgi:hypothetical protein
MIDANTSGHIGHPAASISANTQNSPIMPNVTAVTVSGQWHFSKRNRRRGNGMRPPKNHARSSDGCRSLHDPPVARRVVSDGVREKIRPVSCHAMKLAARNQIGAAICPQLLWISLCEVCKQFS